MILWRLTTVPSLDGKGGLKASGRWHTRGRRIVYTSEHPEGALLEVLVHLDVEPGELPAGQRLLSLDVPDELEMRGVRMPRGWQTDEAQTHSKGDAWLAAGATPLLRVPSAIVGGACNVLINPEHPAAKRVRVAGNEPFAIDRRLLKRR